MNNNNMRFTLSESSSSSVHQTPDEEERNEGYQGSQSESEDESMDSRLMGTPPSTVDGGEWDCTDDAIRGLPHSTQRTEVGNRIKGTSPPSLRTVDLGNKATSQSGEETTQTDGREVKELTGSPSPLSSGSSIGEESGEEDEEVESFAQPTPQEIDDDGYSTTSTTTTTHVTGCEKECKDGPRIGGRNRSLSPSLNYKKRPGHDYLDSTNNKFGKSNQRRIPTRTPPSIFVLPAQAPSPPTRWPKENSRAGTSTGTGNNKRTDQPRHPRMPQQDGYNYKINKSNRDRYDNKSPQLQRGVSQKSTTDQSTNYQNTRHTTNLSIQDEVQQLVEGTSSKFVPTPTPEMVAIDLFEGIRRYQNSVRWKEHWRKKAIDEINKKRLGLRAPPLLETQYDTQLDDLELTMDLESKGLKTGLHPKYTTMNAPTGSPHLEAHIQDVKVDLFTQLDGHMNAFRDINWKSIEVKTTIKNLKAHPDLGPVATDKTNSCVLMDIKEYDRQMLEHLTSRAKEVTVEELNQEHQISIKCLKNIQGLLSKQEYKFIKETVDKKGVPQPKLLIKDHKKKDPLTGAYPSRLIAPGQNFNSGFPKTGYLAIKRLFDLDGCFKHRKHLIEQAYHLKHQLDTLNLTTSNCTIMSLAACAYYPSIRFKLVKKAIEFFAQDLMEEDRRIIEKALTMVQKGMNSTYLEYEGKCYLCDGEESPEDKALTIGGYESAWLSDVVGSHTFQMTEYLFQDMVNYHGICRDDGLVAFKGKLMRIEIDEWLSLFQAQVNIIAEGDYLKFTAISWKDPKVDPPIYPSPPRDANLTVHDGETFPCLDMELHWNDQKELESRVNLKPNQQLLCLNKESCHPHHIFENIPKGVYQRLAKLTTMNNDNCSTTMNQLCPIHFKALKKAGLLERGTTTPTLAEIMEEVHHQEIEKKEEGPSHHKQNQKKRDRGRNVYFCVAKAAGWKIPMWKTLEKHQKKRKLPWLKVRM